MLLVCTACGKKDTGAKTSSEVSAPALIKSVTAYGVDFETGEFHELKKTSYEYKDAYPVSKELYEIDSDARTRNTFEYTFEDGVPTKMSTFDAEGKLDTTTEYVNGRITEVIRKVQNADGKAPVNDAKFVFEYTDIAIDKVRYSSMINAHIIDEGNTFYIYNWY